MHLHQVRLMSIVAVFIGEFQLHLLMPAIVPTWSLCHVLKIMDFHSVKAVPLMGILSRHHYVQLKAA
jgi:hypothetical protein